MAALDAGLLTPRFRAALAGLARRLDRHGVPFVVGGSAMLACRGLNVSVADLDICTADDQLDGVLAALESFNPVVLEGAPPPWRSTWLVRTELPDRGGDVASGGHHIGVDIIGDLAIEVDGVVATFPLDTHLAEAVEVDGMSVPFDSMWRWYHLYRVHDPAKAAQIAAVAGPEVLETAAVELGL